MWARQAFACALLLATAVGSSAQGEVRAFAGEYSVTMTADGFLIDHGGQPITLGSYFTVFRPKYDGSVFTSAQAWDEGAVVVSDDARTITLTAATPEGRVSYSVDVSEKGLRVRASITIAEGVETGAVEYAAFQFRPELVEGATVDVWDAAGAVIDRQEVPIEPERGGFAQSGAGLTLRTPERRIIISSSSPIGIYPFDARVEQYGAKQGVWAFTSIPVASDTETVSEIDLSIAPPEPQREPGTVRIGKAAATAVATAPNATARENLAADELVAYIQTITAVDLERIVIGDGRVPKGVIAVGSLATEAGLISQRELDQVRRDGYVVKVRNGRAAVCGWRDLGTVYGAYALLREIGVTFYAPTCEAVPELGNLVIADCRLSAKPHYEFRHMTGNLKLGQTPRDDVGSPAEIGEPGNLVHAADYLLPFDEYGEEHPEYFALQKDGTRLHRDPNATRFDVHLCLSNEDVRRISAERLLALIEAQPDRTFFGVSQGDGFAWCECKECKAQDARPGEMTDRLVDYVNHVAREVAKEYPDKRILTLAYTDATSPPPIHVMPEPNVMLQFCPYPGRTRCQNHGFAHPENRQGFEDLTGWIAQCPENMYIFDYPRGYKIWYEPFGSFWAMKSKLDFYAANGIRGIYYCGVPNEFRDLFVWVQSRLLWEPQSDVEALIDGFMAAYYGDGAPHVRAYFDLLHEAAADPDRCHMCEGANPGLLTAELTDQALGIFDEAERATADDRAALYRVRGEKLHVLFGDVDVRNPVNGQLAVSRDEFAERLAELMRIGRTHRISVVGRSESGVVSDWLYRTARIRTERSPWYADRLVDRMAADPSATLAEEQQLYSQTRTPAGWRLELDGFLGTKLPSEYGYNCTPKRAVWIYGKNTQTPAMWTVLNLDEPPAAARLVLLAQDDDKPGAVRISITVNDVEVFAGPNPFVEGGWSKQAFEIPAGLLKAGENEFRFASLGDSPTPDAGWFMVAECAVEWE